MRFYETATKCRQGPVALRSNWSARRLRGGWLRRLSSKKGEKPEFKNDFSVTFLTASIVFGYMVRSDWTVRKQWLFWVSWSVLLTAHFVILLPILSRMQKVPLVLGAIIPPLEMVIVYRLLDFAGERFKFP